MKKNQVLVGNDQFALDERVRQYCGQIVEVIDTLEVSMSLMPIRRVAVAKDGQLLLLLEEIDEISGYTEPDLK